MPLRQLAELLNQQHIPFDCINHSPAYTAQEVAQSVHIPGKGVAKTVIIKMSDGHMAMVVLSANDKINFRHLTQSLGHNNIQIASEREFRDKFPGCEVGAMPPFGNLWGMEVFVDEKLAKDPEIAFNAGSHTELMRMHYADFEKLVKPKILQAA